MKYKRSKMMPVLIIIAAVVSLANLIFSMNSSFYHIVHRYGQYEGLVLDGADYVKTTIALCLIVIFLICAALLIAFAAKRTKVISIFSIVFAVLDILFILFMLYSYYGQYFYLYVDMNFVVATILVLTSNVLLLAASVVGIRSSYDPYKEKAIELAGEVEELKRRLNEKDSEKMAR